MHLVKDAEIAALLGRLGALQSKQLGVGLLLEVSDGLGSIRLLLSCLLIELTHTSSAQLSQGKRLHEGFPFTLPELLTITLRPLLEAIAVGRRALGLQNMV